MKSNKQRSDEVSNELQALAMHLGIDVAKKTELDAIEFIDENTGVHRFRYARRVYVVAPESHGLPTNVTVCVNGSDFAITNKYMIKVMHLRTPAAIKEGMEDMVGQIYEYTGNAHGGFKVIVDEKNRLDLFHFAHIYINN